MICGSSEHHGDEHHDVRGHFPYHKYAAAPVTDAGLREALIRSLETIHGNIVPLPNRPSVADYADMILRWMPALSRQTEKETA